MVSIWTRQWPKAWRIVSDSKSYSVWRTTYSAYGVIRVQGKGGHIGGRTWAWKNDLWTKNVQSRFIRFGSRYFFCRSTRPCTTFCKVSASKLLWAFRASGAKFRAKNKLDENEENGIILQEIQKGFTIKDRLLRPSLVGVSKKISKKDQKNEEIYQKTGDK